MRCLIIEDEYHAARYLQTLLREVAPSFEVAGVLDSITAAVDFLRQQPAPELIFMDIQLADGLSFSIFQQVEVKAPVIFTTAFDQYTLQAFKVNSIDYLLKPIDREELHAALQKHSQLHQPATVVRRDDLRELAAQLLNQETHRRRFLVKLGNDYIYVPISEVAYLYSEDGITFLLDRRGQRYMLDAPLDQLEKEIDPAHFFRVNRAYLVHIDAIERMQTYFNHRLLLQLRPRNVSETIVSRDRVRDFKAWIDR